MKKVFISLGLFTFLFAQDTLDALIQSQQETPQTPPSSKQEALPDLISPAPQNKQESNQADPLLELKSNPSIAQEEKQPPIQPQEQEESKDLLEPQTNTTPQEEQSNLKELNQPQEEQTQLPSNIQDQQQVSPPKPQTQQTPLQQAIPQDKDTPQLSPSSASPINPKFFDYNKDPSKERLRAITLQELRAKMSQCEEKEDKDVCFEVGMLFYQGRSVYGQKLEQALYFLDRSCDEKRGLGCYEAGIISANFHSYQHAFIFLEKSCQSGDLRGCKNLGILYYNGWGTPKNIYKATELFNLGCKKGDKLSCQKLYLALGNAYQESLNYVGAKKNYQKACELGEEEGCTKVKAIDMLEKQLYYEKAIKNNVLKK